SSGLSLRYHSSGIDGFLGVYDAPVQGTLSTCGPVNRLVGDSRLIIGARALSFPISTETGNL
ncbi:MAG: hypothetical protein ACRYGG_15295, partial [Janthinobacterium lividum]